MILDRPMSARNRRPAPASPLRRLLPLLALVGLALAGWLLWQTWRGVDDTRYHSEIAVAARRHGIDPELVRAVIWQESRFDAAAVGGAGEIGLMQILPGGAVAEWARIMRCPAPPERQLFRPEVNLEIGCFYLARALRRWSGYKYGTALALAQYNAGESRAKTWAPETRDGEVVPRIRIASTKKYVETIVKRYRKYLCERSGGKRSGGK